MAHYLESKIKNPLSAEQSIYCDLLSNAISKINYFEVAESFLDDIDD